MKETFLVTFGTASFLPHAARVRILLTEGFSFPTANCLRGGSPFLQEMFN